MDGFAQPDHKPVHDRSRTIDHRRHKDSRGADRGKPDLQCAPDRDRGQSDSGQLYRPGSQGHVDRSGQGRCGRRNGQGPGDPGGHSAYHSGGLHSNGFERQL